jgi:tetratricopeptide (TPR) repeat protein
MNSHFRSLFVAAALGLIMVAAPFASAQVKTANLEKEMIELNKMTGEQAMQGLLQNLLNDKDRAKRMIAMAVEWTKEKDKLNYNFAYVLGLMAGDMKDLPACEKLMRVCIEHGVKLQSPRRLVQSYGALIDVYFENKKYDQSARLCNEVLNLKTDDGKERIVYQAITTRLGDTDFIEDDAFDAAKNLRPGVRRLLIKSITKQGKYEDALKHVDELIKSEDHWQERQLKAWVYHEAGQFDDAARTYEDVIERITKDRDLDPDEREAYVERQRYIMSSVYIDMKRVDKATEVLQTLLANKPDSPSYNNDLGYIWADNDMNLVDAERMIRKALELDRKQRQKAKISPDEDHDNGAYLDSLGWVLFKQKKYKEAKEAMLEAIKDKNSQHIEIYDHLGDILMALGEKQAAIDAWKKGLEHVTDSRRDQERKKTVEAKLEKHKQ